MQIRSYLYSYDLINFFIEGTGFPDAFGNVMAYFFECLHTGEKPITHGHRNLHVVQTLSAMHQSASSEEGRPA